MHPLSTTRDYLGLSTERRRSSCLALEPQTRSHHRPRFTLPSRVTRPQVIMFYFSASWCGPCRAFTPALRKWYQRHAAAKQLEIVFVSNDRDANEFNSYFAPMGPPPPPPLSLLWQMHSQREMQAMDLPLPRRHANHRGGGPRRIRHHQLHPHAACGRRRQHGAAHQRRLPLGQEG
jgi:thiol-disulfide isomerase/thioredoxin